MYTIDALIPFECIVDIDMGLIKLLKFEYRNPEYFFKGILDGPDDCIEYELVNRKNRNPLSIPTNMSKVDDETIGNWYQQFIEKEYTKIMELSTSTSLADLVKLSSFNTDKVLRTTILCSNDEEANIVRKRSYGETTIVVDTNDTFDITKYDAVYLKDVYDIEQYTGVVGKTIYVANYAFNILDNTESDDVVLDYTPLIKYLDDNEIRVYTVYNLDPSQYNSIKEV